MANNLKLWILNLWTSLSRNSLLILGITVFLSLTCTTSVYAAPNFNIDTEEAAYNSDLEVYRFINRFPLDVIIEFKLDNPLTNITNINSIEVSKIEYRKNRNNQMEKKVLEVIDKKSEEKWIIDEVDITNNIYRIVPDKILDPSSVYEIKIPDGGNDYYIEVQTVYSLEDLIVDYLDEFNAMINEYSFQGLDVLVPTQYITKGELIYTPISSENSEGDDVDGYFINIDITAASEIEEIAVTFNEEFDESDLSDGFINPRDSRNGYSETTHTAISDGKVFNTGYVYDDDDIEKDVLITCWDSNERIIDQKVVHFSTVSELRGKKQPVVEKPKRLKEATLYDLIKKNSLFEDYLEQFTLDKIYINSKS